MPLYGWDESKKIKFTIDNADIDSRLDKFPVVINISASSGKTGVDLTKVFTELGTNSKKVAFELGDTGIQCYGEIEHWDNSNNKAVVHIEVNNIKPGYSDNTKFLLNSNTTDGNVSFIDNSNYGHIITPNGSVHHEVDQQKFGTTSIHFNGSTDYLRVPYSDELVLGQYFTVDWWDYYITIPDASTILSDSSGATYSGLLLGFLTSGGSKVYMSSNNSSWDIASAKSLGSAVTGAWAHRAVSRSGDNFYAFKDGVQTDTWTSKALAQTMSGLSIGQRLTGYFNGYVDALRFTIGEALWTSGFTPPTAVATKETAPTVINMYYDGSHANNDEYIGVTGSKQAQRVWDSNFKAVYHMAQDPSGGTDCILDSTSNVNHGTPGGVMTTADLVYGSLGKGIEFDGSNDFINTGIVATASQDYTADVLFKLTNTASNNVNVLISGGYGGDPDGIIIESTLYATGAPSYNLGSSCTHDITHIDGVSRSIPYTGFSVGSYICASTSLNVDNQDGGVHYIGANNNGSNFFGGVIEEVRISSVDRSNDWMIVTNLSLNDSLFTISDPDSAPSWDTAEKAQFTIAASDVDSDQTNMPVPFILSSSAGTTSYDCTNFINEMFTLKDSIIYNNSTILTYFDDLSVGSAQITGTGNKLNLDLITNTSDGTKGANALTKDSFDFTQPLSIEFDIDLVPTADWYDGGNTTADSGNAGLFISIVGLSPLFGTSSDAWYYAKVVSPQILLSIHRPDKNLLHVWSNVLHSYQQSTTIGTTHNVKILVDPRTGLYFCYIDDELVVQDIVIERGFTGIGNRCRINFHWHNYRGITDQLIYNIKIGNMRDCSRRILLKEQSTSLVLNTIINNVDSVNNKISGSVILPDLPSTSSTVVGLYADTDNSESDYVGNVGDVSQVLSVNCGVGSPFSGNIVTVGPDRQFSNIIDAIDFADDGDIILLDPGKYDEGEAIYVDKHVHFKGRTDGLDKAVIFTDTSGESTRVHFRIRTDEDTTWHNDVKEIYIEGITSYIDNNYYGCIEFWQESDVTIYVNRCELLHMGANYTSKGEGYSIKGPVINTMGRVHLRQCDLRKASYVIADFDGVIATMHIERCLVHDGTLDFYSSTQALSTNDHVTTPTVGYGHKYGAWMIPVVYSYQEGYADNDSVLSFGDTQGENSLNTVKIETTGLANSPVVGMHGTAQEFEASDILELDVTPSNFTLTFTIPANTATSNLSNFPVALLFKTTAGTGDYDNTDIFKVIGGDWSRIKLLDSSSTRLYGEIDHWEAHNSRGMIHVKINITNYTTDTVITVDYNPSNTSDSTYIGATGSTPGQTVWDSDFMFVCHMSQYPDSSSYAMLDSTSNEWNARTVHMDDTDWVYDDLGYGMQLAGDYDKLDTLAHDWSALESLYTLESVHDVVNVDNYDRFIQVGIDTGAPVLTSYAALDKYDVGAGEPTGSMAIGTLQHAAATFDGTDVFLTVDGVEDSVSATRTLPDLSNDILYIGALNTNGTPNIEASIYEIRISKTERTTDWLNLTALSMSDTLMVVAPDSTEICEFSLSWALKPDTLSDNNQHITAGNGWGSFNCYAHAAGGLTIGTDLTNAFTPTDTGVVLTPGSWSRFVYTYDGTNGRLYKDGTLVAGPTAQDSPENWDGLLFGGASGDLDGLLDEVKYFDSALSADYIEIMDSALEDGLLLFEDLSSTFPVNSIHFQTYNLTFVQHNFLNQPYQLTYPILIYLDQEYKLTLNAFNYLSQIYALRFHSSLIQSYVSSTIVTASLWQWYRSHPKIRNLLDQFYTDHLEIRASSEQIYSLAGKLVTILSQEYSVIFGRVLSYTEELYDIRTVDELLAYIRQQYILFPDSVTEYSSELEIIVGDVTLGGSATVSGGSGIVGLSIEFTQGSYAGSASLQLSHFSDWALIDYQQEVVITYGGQEFHFVVVSKSRKESHKTESLTVECKSQAVLLDFPFASEVPDVPDFEVSGTVSEIVNDLAALEGLSISWEIPVNDTLTVNEIQVVGKSPLACIKEIVNALGGIVQSHPDGTIHAVPRYITNSHEYSSVSPEAIYTSGDSFIELSGETDKRDGYNKYSVTNIASTDGYTLDTEEISPNHYKVKAFKVPWTSAAVRLETSELTNVIISTPRIEVREVRERIEIVEGVGKVSKPFYQFISKDYETSTDLGNVSILEDGTVTTDTIDNTLVIINYRTKYWLWDCYDTDEEDVQFILVANPDGYVPTASLNTLIWDLIEPDAENESTSKLPFK